MAATETDTFIPATPEATPVPFYCGESEQTPVDGGVYRLIRSQGVSSFNPDNTPGILNQKVRSVFIDPTGLWMGFFQTDANPIGGLAHFDKKNKLISDCSLPALVQGQNINVITGDSLGRLWVGTEKQGIAMYDGRNWRLFTREDGLPSDWIYDLYVDGQNRVYAGTWEGVAVYDGSRWSPLYTFANGTIFDNKVHSIRIDSAGNIWVGHIDAGVSFYSAAEKTWNHLTRESGELRADAVRAITVQPAGEHGTEAVWVATDGGGVSRYQDGAWTHFGVAQGLPSDQVEDVEVDRYLRVWIATAGGVAYYDQDRWFLYDTLNTYSLAFGVDCPDKSCSIDNDNVYAGTTQMGVTQSRLPLQTDGLTVTKVCFIAADRSETCPDLVKDDAGTAGDCLVSGFIQTGRQILYLCYGRAPGSIPVARQPRRYAGQHRCG